MHAEPEPNADTSLSCRMAVWLATGLGVGLVVPAPGTVAGLWGLLLVPPVSWLATIGLQLAAISALLLVAVRMIWEGVS